MSFKTILPALGICLLAALCLMSTAQAQVLRTVKVELGKDTQAVNIGPELYITRDETRNLNYKTIITRHLNNQRGLRESGPVVQLGTKGVPVWMLFTVENKSDHQSWILDFGDPSEGRYALISRLLVRNDTQGQTILRQLRESNQPPQGELAGSSMLLPIPPGQTSLFVIYAEPYAGLAGTIAPRLIRHEHAISTPLAGKPFSILALGLFTVMGGFLAALAFARKSYGMLYFSLYYALHIGLML
ncbi:MAG TPA: 7TM-DISM domain-containing protein, partial [Alphaproteobacteria bacterium]|nr:7TM-DISM domain-containing protein [Alphaproteobacteria bacterium]